jgi:hypothetical protein
MKPLGDLNWRLASLVSFLYAFGGWGFSPVRRFGVPAAIVLWAALYFGLQRKWYLGVYAILYALIFFALRPPITLFGDEVVGNWMNWLWVWILGAVHAAALFPLIFLSVEIDASYYKKDIGSRLNKWLLALGIQAIVFGSFLTLSNLTGFPVHAWVEICAGLSFGALAAWIIGER